MSGGLKVPEHCTSSGDGAHSWMVQAEATKDFAETQMCIYCRTLKMVPRIHQLAKGAKPE